MNMKTIFLISSSCVWKSQKHLCRFLAFFTCLNHVGLLIYIAGFCKNLHLGIIWISPKEESYVFSGSVKYGFRKHWTNSSLCIDFFLYHKNAHFTSFYDYIFIYLFSSCLFSKVPGIVLTDGTKVSEKY